MYGEGGRIGPELNGSELTEVEVRDLVAYFRHPTQVLLPE